MIYLQNFKFPLDYAEENYLDGYYSTHVGNTYHTNMYPFRMLSRIGMFRLAYEPITILYGGKGSGKSRALNAISKTIGILSKSLRQKK